MTGSVLEHFDIVHTYILRRHKTSNEPIENSHIRCIFDFHLMITKKQCQLADLKFKEREVLRRHLFFDFSNFNRQRRLKVPKYV